jgi:radical SAM enzyme (TIGR01210 family)
MTRDVTEQIEHGSQAAGKNYQFDEAHDPTRPAEMWFQESEEGEILFLVFYTQACRWSQCLGCNLPSKMSKRHVSFRELTAQVDFVFRDTDVAGRRESIHKVIVSNNGSVLDEVTFSSTALVYLISQLNLHLPNLSVLSIETRPEYVDLAELEFLARVLSEGDTPTVLEIAVGFEAFDDRIRNDVFRKGLPLEAFEKCVRKIAPYGFHLKCYFMQKPVPGMSDEEAVADVYRAIDFLGRLAEQHGIPVNLHLNPTFVAVGTPLAEAFGRREYAPPLLRDVARAARGAHGKPLSVFIGLNDEGLAVTGGSFIREGDEHVVTELERFNRTQDYTILDRISDS